MAQRIPSSMTGKQLQAWRNRYALSLTAGSQRLGVSRSMFAEYLAGTIPIPRTVALLCACYERLWRSAKHMEKQS